MRLHYFVTILSVVNLKGNVHTLVRKVENFYAILLIILCQSYTLNLDKTCCELLKLYQKVFGLLFVDMWYVLISFPSVKKFIEMCSQHSYTRTHCEVEILINIVLLCCDVQHGTGRQWFANFVHAQVCSILPISFVTPDTQV